jgi:uroporphyrinogen-III synthase
MASGMEPNRINILCTRPLGRSLITEVREQGIEIDELSFIRTEPIQSIEVQQEIEQAFLLTVPVVFTSMNAVEAVAYFQEDSRPEWDIYCIGNTTAKLVSKYFGEQHIAGTAVDAASLAELIVEVGVTGELIFFCGDQRRDELPRVLREHDIEVNEITVYQTIALPHKIEKDYRGILFFSPSAVESFFTKNKLPQETILFAIGNTTATEIRKHTRNKILISDEPGKENLVRKMIDYFAPSY